MDWSTVGNAVARAAPLLGTALLGPAGTAIGGIVAAALGVESDAEAVSKALTTNPDAYVRLREVETRHRERLEELAIQEGVSAIQAVNQTMQVEAKAEDVWTRRWRPFWGYVSALAFFAQVGAIAYLMVTGGDTQMVTALASLDVFWVVPLAILGVASWHRGQLHRTRAGEERAPLLSLGK